MRAEQAGFVQAWSVSTGAEQWVPAHFFDSPVTSRGLTTTNPNPDPAQVPSLDWTRKQLDAYAGDRLGLDTTGEANKADVLAVIDAATPADPVDDGPTPDDPQTQQQNDSHETPVAGENQE